MKLLPKKNNIVLPELHNDSDTVIIDPNVYTNKIFEIITIHTKIKDPSTFRTIRREDLVQNLWKDLWKTSKTLGNKSLVLIKYFKQFKDRENVKTENAASNRIYLPLSHPASSKKRSAFCKK